MIYELRQYTLWPGKREVLIELFDREFLEGQEVTGMRIDGQFRDEDRPDHFVWVRSFPDMEGRATSLEAFYGGPVWQAHRGEANSTMIDSDDVLLLRPAGPVWELPAQRPPQGTVKVPSTRFTASIAYLPVPVTRDFRDFFAAEVAPAAPVVAQFETEYAENTFPALPVRTGEHVYVWFTRGEAPPTPPGLAEWLTKPVQTLRLTPTARSLLR
jgi:NIPSNAP